MLHAFWMVNRQLNHRLPPISFDEVGGPQAQSVHEARGMLIERARLFDPWYSAVPSRACRRRTRCSEPGSASSASVVPTAAPGRAVNTDDGSPRCRRNAFEAIDQYGLAAAFVGYRAYFSVVMSSPCGELVPGNSFSLVCQRVTLWQLDRSSRRRGRLSTIGRRGGFRGQSH
jgi:hypothetical protein